MILHALIFEEGSVGLPHVLTSDAQNSDFNVASKQTVAFWRFDPARLDGCAVTVRFTVIVEFSH